MSGKPLPNDAHERFCEEYLLDLNATAAYQRAYPTAARASAGVGGAQLLGKPRVAERIAELQAERAERVKVKLDDVLRELMVLAFSDVRHFHVDELGHLLLSPDAPESAWRAVSRVKHRVIPGRAGEPAQREVEYGLWNKNDALKQLREHLGQAAGEESDVIPLAVMRKAIAMAQARRDNGKAASA